MGFKMEKYGPLLDSLAGYLEEAGLATVTTQAAVEWAMLPQGVHPHRWKQRLDAARGFARYLAASDPAAEVPPAGLLDARPNRHRALHLHRTGDRRAARGGRAAPLAPARRHLSRPVRADRRHRHAAQRGNPPRRRRRGPGRGDDHDPGLQVRQVPADPRRRDRHRRAAGLPPSGAGRCARRRQRRRCSSPPTGPGSSATMPTPSSAAITILTGIGANAVNTPRIHDLRHSFRGPDAGRLVPRRRRRRGQDAAPVGISRACEPCLDVLVPACRPRAAHARRPRLENTEAAS